MQFIIAGFHRSGTSLFTQLLHRAGLHVGDRLLGAMPSNPYGHFEDREFLELHRSILWEHGTDWQWRSTLPMFISEHHWQAMRALIDAREVRHRAWGFKDPRVCFFLGAWKYLMPDAKALVVYRDPADCVRSLESRQGRAYFAGEGKPSENTRFFRMPDHGLRLWNTYNKAIVSFARANIADCLVIPYSHLTEGAPVISLINNRYNADFKPVETSEVFDFGATHRRNAPQIVLDKSLKEEVERTWRDLEELTKLTVTSGEDAR